MARMRMQIIGAKEDAQNFPDGKGNKRLTSFFVFFGIDTDNQSNPDVISVRVYKDYERLTSFVVAGATVDIVFRTFKIYNNKVALTVGASDVKLAKTITSEPASNGARQPVEAGF